MSPSGPVKHSWGIHCVATTSMPSTRSYQQQPTVTLFTTKATCERFMKFILLEFIEPLDSPFDTRRIWARRHFHIDDQRLHFSNQGSTNPNHHPVAQSINGGGLRRVTSAVPPNKLTMAPTTYPPCPEPGGPLNRQSIVINSIIVPLNPCSNFIKVREKYYCINAYRRCILLVRIGLTSITQTFEMAARYTKG
jgi:hypothetical protein